MKSKAWWVPVEKVVLGEIRVVATDRNEAFEKAGSGDGDFYPDGNEVVQILGKAKEVK